MGRIPRSIRRFLALLACSAGLLWAAGVAATTVPIVASGNYTYTFVGPNVILTVDRLDNNGLEESGELQMEFWALPQPYQSLNQVNYDQTGFRMAMYPLGRLAPRKFMANVSSGPIPMTFPPPGTWSFVTIITQYDASAINDHGFLPAQFHNFVGAIVVNPPAIGAPVSGLWWDPTQPGSGYSIQVSGSNATIVVYGFQPNGLAQWWLSAGPLTTTTSAVTFTGPLNKYVGGPCIPCNNDPRFPVPMGSDGTMSISFSSPTSGTVFLPGGRIANIIPTGP